MLNRYSSETPNLAELGFAAATQSEKIRKPSQKEISNEEPRHFRHSRSSWGTPPRNSRLIAVTPLPHKRGQANCAWLVGPPESSPANGLRSGARARLLPARVRPGKAPPSPGKRRSPARRLQPILPAHMPFGRESYSDDPIIRESYSDNPIILAVEQNNAP